MGRRDGGYVEVVQGLAAGTQVASTGSFILKSELGKGSAEHAH
jgi:cobalt-zinc-cadmium efflux system membrane fusion protein